MKRSIGRLVGIMLIVVVMGILIAKTYYGKQNRSVDPRVVPARELYEGYNAYARTGNYHQVFALLDSIGQIYRGIPHYSQSFELGVLENNRAAALLTIALYGDSIPKARNPLYDVSADSLLSLADQHVREAIGLYDRWNAAYEGLGRDQIREKIRGEFMQGLEPADADLNAVYLETRIDEILEALEENKRRLSVCYTNLGLVCRIQGEYESAVKHYEHAIALWERNLDAENNLNRLLNRPLKKRNFIQRMFPPSKEISPKK
jgi:tetratricopeptide (TPR) repeat protein